MTNAKSTNQNLNDLRPQKLGWKSLKKMTKRELLDEIARLDEVLQITSRRLNRRVAEELTSATL